MRKLVLPTIVGFVLFYVVLMPIARWLLFGVRASGSVYTASVWTLLAAAILTVASLVVHDSGLSGVTAAFSVVAAGVVSAASLAAIALLVGTLGTDTVWLFTEPATIVQLLLASLLVVGVTLKVTTLFRSRVAISQ